MIFPVNRTNFNNVKQSCKSNSALKKCASAPIHTKNIDNLAFCNALKAMNNINFKGKPIIPTTVSKDDNSTTICYYDKSGNLIKTTVDSTVNGKRTLTTNETKDDRTIKTIEQLDNKGNIKLTQKITTQQIENGKIETTERIIKNRTISKISTQETEINGIKTKIKISYSPKATTIETTITDNETKTTTKQKFASNGEFIEKTITKRHLNENYLEEIESFDKNGISQGLTRKSLIKDDNNTPVVLIEKFDDKRNLISSSLDTNFSKKYEKSKIQLTKNAFEQTKNMNEKELRFWAEKQLCEFFDTPKTDSTTIQEWAKSLLNNSDYKNWKDNIKEPSVILPCAGKSKLAQKINALSDTSQAFELKAPVRDIATKNKTKILSAWFENILENIATDKNNTALNYTILSQIADIMDSTSAHLPKKYDADVLNQTIENMRLNISLNESISKNIICVYKNFAVKKALSKLADENFDTQNSTGWITLTKGNTKELAILSHDTWCTSSTSSNNYLNSGDFLIYYENGKPVLGVKLENKEQDENDDNKIAFIKEIQGISNDCVLPYEKFPIIKDFLENFGVDFNNLYQNRFSKNVGKNNVNIRTQIQNAALQYYFSNNTINSNTTQKELYEILGIREENLEKTNDNHTIIPDNYIANTTINLLKDMNLFYTFAENSKIKNLKYTCKKLNSDKKQITVENDKFNITIQKITDKNNKIISTTYKNSTTNETLNSVVIKGKTYVVSDKKVYELNNDNFTDKSYSNEPLYDKNGNFKGIKQKTLSGSCGVKFEYNFSAYEFFDNFGELLSKKEILKSDEKTIEIEKNSLDEYISVSITENSNGKTQKYNAILTPQQKNTSQDIVLEDIQGRKYTYNTKTCCLKNL